MIVISIPESGTNLYRPLLMGNSLRLWGIAQSYFYIQRCARSAITLSETVTFDAGRSHNFVSGSSTG